MTESPRVRRSIRRLAYWVFPVLALIVAWQVWDAAEARRLDAELARLFPEGVDPRPRWSRESPPQYNDAAVYYAAANLAGLSAGSVDRLNRALEMVPTHQLIGDARRALMAGDDVSADVFTELGRLFDIYELPLRLLEDASTRPFFRVSNVNVERALTLTGFVPALAVAGARTLTLLQTRDADAAVNSLIVRIEARRAYDDQAGWYATSLKSREVDDVAVDVAILLARTSPSEAALARLNDALAGAHDDEEIVRLVRNEARFLHATLRRVWRGDDPTAGLVAVLGRPALRGLVSDAVRTGRELTAAARLPWPERLRAIERIDDRPGVSAWFAFGSPIGRSWRIADMTGSSSVGVAAGLASVRCARAAIAVERYRRERGSLPGDLGALGVDPSALVDPFSGEPLKYMQDEAGYTIYSVGDDRKDDGGRLDGERSQSPVRSVGQDRGIRVRRT